MVKVCEVVTWPLLYFMRRFRQCPSDRPSRKYLLHELADEEEIHGHADADGGQNESEDNGIAGDAAWLPCTRAELVDELDMAKHRAEVDDDAESDEGYSRPEREAGGASGDVRVGGD